MTITTPIVRLTEKMTTLRKRSPTAASPPSWKLPLGEVDKVARIVIHHADAISRGLGYHA